MHTRPARSFVTLTATVVVAALAVFAYRGAITSDFPGGDTLALIEVSRIHSFGDLMRVLTQPMLPIITKFYRPTANLSYAIDYRIWGLDARGFHITDVLIHASVAALIILLVQRWSKNTLAAFLAGATFALHPILMETVPNPTRRQDMLGGLFMLLALLCLPHFEERKSGWCKWIPALLFSALAMGAKEGSVVLPALVFAWALVLLPPGANDRPTWKSALKFAAPFALLALAFVALRAWILGGAGGNEYSWRWTPGSIAGLGENTLEYLDDLLYPLRVVFHPYLNTLDRTVALAAALGFFFVIPGITRWWNTEPARSRALFRCALILCGAVLLFPAVSPWIKDAIEHAHREHGQPAGFYVWKAFDMARQAATAALIVVGILVVINCSRARRAPPLAKGQPRWMMFTLLWIALHLALFLAVQRYHAWNAYVPTIPFCCFLGLVIAQVQPGARIFKALAGGLMISLALNSPIVRNLDIWRVSGRFNSMIMAEVARIAAEVPAGSTVEFRDLPNLNFSWHERGPEPSSAFTFNEASAISWVKILQPDKHLQVEVPTQKSVFGSVAAIHMEWENSAGNRIIVRSTTTAVARD